MRIIIDIDKLPQGGYVARSSVTMPAPADVKTMPVELADIYAEKAETLAHRIGKAVKGPIKAI